MFLEDLASLVLWLLALVLGLNCVFLLFILSRRLSRQRYFVRKDAAVERFKDLIAQFANGDLDLEKAAAVLALASTTPEREAVYQLAAQATTPENWESITDLLFLLGFVDEWAKAAFGRKAGKRLVAISLKRKKYAFQARPKRVSPIRRVRCLRVFAVPRAIAVAHLGRLAPAFAQSFLARALEDPAHEVRRVAIASMGRNRFPEAVPLLVQELLRAIEQQNDISLRTMKSALIHYRLEDLGDFVSHIRHSEKRGRFFIVDSIRQICEREAAQGHLGKNDFPPQLYELLLEDCASDDFEDVRARTAAIIRYFRDERSLAVMRKLLRDENEFVRLHSVRACGDPYFVDLIPDIVSRLTDVRWRVREAAVSSLNRMGVQGREELFKFFVECTDRFASEQIGEELQRMGVVSELVGTITLGGDAALLAQAVADKLVALGKTSMLLATMASSDSSTACIALIEALANNPQMEYLELLEEFSRNRTGQVQAKAKQILRRLGASPSSSSMSASAGGPTL